MSLAWLWLRRLADERAASLGLVLLVFVTALAAAVGPRLLERMSDEALRAELASAPTFERNSVIYETARPQARPLVEFDDVSDAGETLERGFPVDVRRLIDGRNQLVETTIWEVLEGTDANSLLRLRVQEGALERVRLVDGRLPTGTVSVVSDERPIAPPNQRAWVYEAILPASALQEMGAQVGEQLWLTAWLGDPLNLGQNVGAFVTVVGSYELVELEDEFWINDEAVGGWRLNILPGTDVTFIQSTALLSPDAYRTLVANTQGVGMTLLYQWRFFMATERLSSARLPAAVGGLRRLEGALPRSGMSDVPSDTTHSSGLLRLLEAHDARWRSAEAVLAVVALGLAGIAGATFAVVAAASSAGRRRAAALLAARGASTLQLSRGAAVEAGLLTFPVAGLAAAVALLLVPDSSLLPALVAAAVVWLAASLVMLALVLLAGRSATEPGRALRVAKPPSARRVLAEIALVLAAFGGAWLLRERGVTGAGSDGAPAGADLLIAAVPALVGVAAGLVAMRVYPLPTRLLGALLARRRELLPVLAVRRIIRGGSSASVLLLLVATASLGAFSAATLVHLERAAELAGWQRVGAPYRISSPSLALPASLDEAALPGVEAAARASLRSIGTDRGTAWLLSVDLPAYERVAAGSPAEPNPPAEMLTDQPADQPVPVIASSNLGLRGGETVQLDLARTVVGRVVELRPAFAGVPPAEPFLVAARHQLAVPLDGRPPADGLVFVRAAAAAADDLHAALAEGAAGLELTSRAEVSRSIAEAPVMGALRALIGAAVLLAVGYAALAVAASFALAAAAQRRQLAHLRALGLSRRGALWLTFIEYGPASLLGYLGGVVLGLSLFAFLRPGLGLAAVSGPVADVPVGVEPLQLVLLLAAIVAILVVGWVLGALAQRDSDPADLMRRGME